MLRRPATAGMQRSINHGVIWARGCLECHPERKLSANLLEEKVLGSDAGLAVTGMIGPREPYGRAILVMQSLPPLVAPPSCGQRHGVVVMAPAVGLWQEGRPGSVAALSVQIPRTGAWGRTHIQIGICPGTTRSRGGEHELLARKALRCWLVPVVLPLPVGLAAAGGAARACGLQEDSVT
ncbi:hypothetical protein NDU88_002173 [Pleurodeles waltl]|uniref:Uncharacterized protein n=1 Tax=Pleurodeles waltl TaxID=8319 RepID=A0AAV7P651_PLEWA|nr:hypothetical protein NDU88_002173 [Pleurodeles waltl]